MFQTTQAMQMNVKFMQQDMLREAEANRLARVAQNHNADGHSAFEHKLVAVAVALVTVLGVVALF